MKKLITFTVIISLLGGAAYYGYHHVPIVREKVQALLADYFSKEVDDSQAEKEPVAEESGVPEYKTPKKEKRKTLKPGPFAKIDAHARNTPEKYEKDIKTLGEYLIEPASNEEEKVRALFTWVATHIKYDDQSYNSGNYGDMSANGVLQSRKAVCEGYGNLLKALCNAVDIDAEKVIGYSKGYGYREGQHFEDTDHAWNVIKINGAWKLFDVTWARGYGETVNGRLVSKTKFDDYWFNVDPKEFIFTHLPENPKWQLLDPKLSLTRFERLPNVGKEFFKHGFSSDYIYSNAINGKIKEFAETYPVDFPVDVETSPYQRNINAGGTYNLRITSDYAEEMAVINNGKWTYFEKKGNLFSLKMVPEKGELSIVVKFHRSDRNFNTMVKFNVIAQAKQEV